jgi:Tfp pilus assembly protein PilV
MFTVKMRRTDSPAGLTLVEFLFATSIIAFVALGVAGMFPSALRSVVAGGQMTKATNLAQAMADMIRNDAFDSLISQYNSLDTRTVNVACPVTGVDMNDNKKKWTCDLLADTAQASGRGLPSAYGAVSIACLNPDGTFNTTSPCPTDLRRITVTVFWDRAGSRSVNVVTYAARSE